MQTSSSAHGRDDHDHGRAPRRRTERGAGEHEDEQQQERAGSRAASGTSRTAKRRRCPRWSAESASSANIAPSANGNAAESTIPAQRTRTCGSRSAPTAPTRCQHDQGEGERRDPDRERSRAADPEQRRQRVVDEAVGDERVAARVPEVVPDGEAVLEQERALVGSEPQIDAGWPEPQEHAGERRPPDGGEEPLAREQTAVCAAHNGEPTNRKRLSRRASATRCPRRSGCPL